MSKKTSLRNKGKDAKDPSIPKDGKDAKDPSIPKDGKDGKDPSILVAKLPSDPIKPLEGKKPYERSTKKEYIDSPSGARSLFEISKTKP